LHASADSRKMVAMAGARTARCCVDGPIQKAGRPGRAVRE
jgi:hypothetical protein